MRHFQCTNIQKLNNPSYLKGLSTTMTEYVGLENSFGVNQVRFTRPTRMKAPCCWLSIVSQTYSRTRLGFTKTKTQQVSTREFRWLIDSLKITHKRSANCNQLVDDLEADPISTSPGTGPGCVRSHDLRNSRRDRNGSCFSTLLPDLEHH